jgi:hypothetical protein
MDMSPPLPQGWHVDAWSVRDGMAFASYRSHEAISTATSSVFIGVPGLDVVPLGSVSPALWAARASFQDGLHDADGQSIGFEDLDQVKELVRRGFLAGGLGPGAPETGETPRGGPPGLPGRLDGLFQDILVHAPRMEFRRPAQGPAERDEFFRSLCEPRTSEVIFELVRTFALAVMTLWQQRIPPLQEWEVGDVEDLLGWTGALVPMLWRHPNDALEHAHRLGAELDLHELLYSWRHGEYFAPTPPNALASAAPCPTRPGWDGRISRLSDRLLVLLATDSAFRSMTDLGDLAPVILSSLIATRPPLAGLSPYRHNFGGYLRVALEWLSNQLPQRRLPDAAEQAIERFVQDRLAPARQAS